MRPGTWALPDGACRPKPRLRSSSPRCSPGPAPALYSGHAACGVTGVQAAAEGGLAPVSIPSLLLMGTIPEKMVVFILVKEFFGWLHPQRPMSAVPSIAMTQPFNDPLEAHLDGVGTLIHLRLE